MSISLTALRKKTDELGQSNLKRTGLASIHGGGAVHSPEFALVFMNPTQRNLSSRPGWKGPRFPFIGTSRVWRLFGDCRLLDKHLADQFNKPADDWTTADARSLETYLAQARLYVTNVIKETAVDSRPPKPAVFQRYQALLHEEMELIKPRLIIAFGLAACKSLTGISIRLEEIYQKALSSERVPIVGDCRSLPVAPCYFPIGRGNPQRAKTILHMITEGKIDSGMAAVSHPNL